MEETLQTVFVSPVSVNIVPEKISVITHKKNETNEFSPGEKQYIILYVKQGSGILKIKQEEYTFDMSTLLFVKPLQKASLVFSSSARLVYMSFYSDSFQIFSDIPLKNDYSYNSFLELEQSIILQNCSAEYACSVILEATSNITRKPFISKKSSDYTENIKRIIEKSYMNQITVKKIADDFSLNRQYLTRLFKSKTGISIQDYIISTRLKKAAELLKSGYSVSDAASLVGYTDQFAFSRIFTKKYGKSPSLYKTGKKEP